MLIAGHIVVLRTFRIHSQGQAAHANSHPDLMKINKIRFSLNRSEINRMFSLTHEYNFNII